MSKQKYITKNDLLPVYKALADLSKKIMLQKKDLNELSKTPARNTHSKKVVTNNRKTGKQRKNTNGKSGKGK